MKVSDMQAHLIKSCGTDLDVVNAARVSFAKESSIEYYKGGITLDDDCQWVADDGSEGWEEGSINGGPHDGETYLWKLRDSDKKLIHYLAKHNHITPFMHCFATFRMKAPIFVARQLVKHQIGLSWNEESRRYIDEEPEFWFPEEWRKRPDGSIKQGSGEKFTDYVYHENTKANREKYLNWTCTGIDRSAEYVIEYRTHEALLDYLAMLDAKVAPEMARMILPLNTMTNWIWSGSLAAWARVANLRLDPHAQLECQMAVKPIAEACSKQWPVSWKALTTSN